MAKLACAFTVAKRQEIPITTVTGMTPGPEARHIDVQALIDENSTFDKDNSSWGDRALPLAKTYYPAVA